MAKAYIGTSGWQYKHWREIFYPKDLPISKWLSFYSQNFQTVEVNSSFYGLPKTSTFIKWKKETPKDFIFSIKGNQYISHIKRLYNCRDAVNIFFNNLQIIGKGHLILWQLPPNLKKDINKLNDFLRLLPNTFRYAIEFRHASWIDNEIFQILNKYNVAVVWQDWHKWPMTRKVTADFVYIRFHGKDNLYASNYLNEELKKWSKIIENQIKKKKDVFVYFNNDACGYAVQNALFEKKLTATL